MADELARVDASRSNWSILHSEAQDRLNFNVWSLVDNSSSLRIPTKTTYVPYVTRRGRGTWSSPISVRAAGLRSEPMETWRSRPRPASTLAMGQPPFCEHCESLIRPNGKLWTKCSRGLAHLRADGWNNSFGSEPVGMQVDAREASRWHATHRNLALAQSHKSVVHV